MSTSPKPPTPETPPARPRPSFRVTLGRLLGDRRGARRAAATAALLRADLDALKEEADALASQARRIGEILADLDATLGQSVILTIEEEVR